MGTPEAGGVALSCRRYEEIDWAAFLHDPRDGSFDAFRAHYPECPECAAEVRRYGEVLAGVEAHSETPPHPGPEELETFERAPGELASARSDYIAAHLRHCASCADELHALRGHRPDDLVAAAAAAPPSPSRRIAAWRWSPVFGLVLVGFLLVPALYRSVAPGPESRPASPSELDAAQTRDLEFAQRPAADSPAAARSPAAEAPLAKRSAPLEPEAEGAAAIDIAETKELPALARAPTAPPRSELAPPSAARSDEGRARSRALPGAETLADADTAGDREAAVPARTPVPREAAKTAASSEAAAPSAGAERDGALGAPAEPSPQSHRAQSAARKSEDPLAHHVWIPTMRLRPGQKSSGPFEELRGGFFLDVPLPRDVPEGEATLRIEAEGLRRQRRAEAEAPAPLDADRRALDALAGGAGAPARSYEERIPVEAKQRALLLQIPPDALAPGIYQVDLEVRSDGAVQGRGRFRLELSED